MQLGLGTVQFGLDYGISNPKGRPSEEEVRSILALAAERKILIIDTAAVYGDSETLLGRCFPEKVPFRVVTKTRPLGECSDTVDTKTWIRDGLLRSLDRLRLESVDTLLVHHVSDLLGPSGDDIYEALMAAKCEGRAHKIGVSAYAGADIDSVLFRYDIDLMQIPVNVLDQRLLSGGQLARLKKRAVEVHVRSVFLQGLLLMEPSATLSYFESIPPQLLEWHDVLKERNITPVQGAFAFVHSLNVDIVLVGVLNAAQLAANHKDFRLAKGINIEFADFALNDEAYTNPSRWNWTL
jgi:aryl-alcohol dehydrogenase-like predicted oxidoreductase